MATIAPIQGVLRRKLIRDLSIALGLGFTMGNAFWYGYHVPRRDKRDNYYSKLEDERAAARQA